jgi:hypothetical protein
MLSYMQVQGITLTYDPDERTLRVGPHGPAAAVMPNWRYRVG